MGKDRRKMVMSEIMRIDGSERESHMCVSGATAKMRLIVRHVVLNGCTKLYSALPSIKYKTYQPHKYVDYVTRQAFLPSFSTSLYFPGQPNVPRVSYWAAPSFSQKMASSSM